MVICSACNLATPIVSGILFEILTGRQPMARYPYFLGLMATLYTVEPLLTRVYIQNVCLAGEKVCRPVSSVVHMFTDGLGAAEALPQLVYTGGSEGGTLLGFVRTGSTARTSLDCRLFMSWVPIQVLLSIRMELFWTLLI